MLMIKILQKENPEYFLSNRNITSKKSLSKSLKLLLLSVTLILFSITVNATQFSYLNSTSRPVNNKISDLKLTSKTKNNVIFGLFKNHISSIDTALILQKCLDSEALAPYFSKNTDGSFIKISIMKYLTIFPPNLSLTKFGETVNFLSRDEIYSNNISSYFIFKVFTIDGDSAKVEFDYISSVSQVVGISANLSKSGSQWLITDSTLNLIN